MEGQEISTLEYMTVEDLQLNTYVGLGMGVAGIALIVSIAVLSFISWFKR